MVSLAARSLGRLTANRSFFFLCDMQEKFKSNIKYFQEIATVAQRLVSAAKILEIPVIATEQYPKGLGNTVTDIDVSGAKVFSKTLFSMVIPEVEQELEKEPERKSVVLFGIETQVCIQQTTLDLLDRGYDVHVVADACSSRSQVDRMFALERMKAAGAFITTSESVLFELMGDAKHPRFKDVQKLVITSAPDSGLLTKL